MLDFEIYEYPCLFGASSCVLNRVRVLQAASDPLLTQAMGLYKTNARGHLVLNLLNS
jgi:hypothetical protein